MSAIGQINATISISLVPLQSTQDETRENKVTLITEKAQETMPQNREGHEKVYRAKQVKVTSETEEGSSSTQTTRNHVIESDSSVDDSSSEVESSEGSTTTTFGPYARYVEDPVETLVFKGGGLRCVNYIGAIKAFEESGLLRVSTRTAGTSGGAITALAVALGWTADEVEDFTRKHPFESFLSNPRDAHRIDEILNEKENWLTKINNIASLLPKLLSEKAIFNGDELRDALDRQIYLITGKRNCTFGKLRSLIDKGKPIKEMHFFAIEIEPGKKPHLRRFTTEFEKHPEDNWSEETIISYAIQASAALPFGFKPVQIYSKRKSNGEFYLRNTRSYFIDGGIVLNLPMVFDQVCYLPEAKRRQFSPSESHNWVFNNHVLGLNLVSNGEKEGSDSPLGILGLGRELFNTVKSVERLQAEMHLEKNIGRVIDIDNNGLKVLQCGVRPDEGIGKKAIDETYKMTKEFLAKRQRYFNGEETEESDSEESSESSSESESESSAPTEVEEDFSFRQVKNSVVAGLQSGFYSPLVGPIITFDALRGRRSLRLGFERSTWHLAAMFDNFESFPLIQFINQGNLGEAERYFYKYQLQLQQSHRYLPSILACNKADVYIRYLDQKKIPVNISVHGSSIIYQAALCDFHQAFKGFLEASDFDVSQLSVTRTMSYLSQGTTLLDAMRQAHAFNCFEVLTEVVKKREEGSDTANRVQELVDLEDQKVNPLFFETTNPRILRYLIKLGLDLTKPKENTNRPLLYELAKMGDIKLVRLYCTKLKAQAPNRYLSILKREVDSSVGGTKTASKIAREKGHKDVMNYLNTEIANAEDASSSEEESSSSSD